MNLNPQPVLICACAALALYVYQGQQEGQGGIIDDISNTIDNFTTDPMSALDSPNVQAFLMLIRTGEGTANANGYNTLYGGGLFYGFDKHPKKAVTAGGITSTAAGAYQFLYRTWQGLGLPDFSPANQDLGAVMLIKRRGALADVLAGRLDAAISKCNKEWASLPGSPYGQPTISMSRAYEKFAQWGGTLEQTA